LDVIEEVVEGFKGGAKIPTIISTSDLEVVLLVEKGSQEEGRGAGITHPHAPPIGVI